MSVSCLARSSESVQHRHPFVSGIRSPSISENPFESMSAASTFTSPMSFTMTAARMPSSFARMWFKSVVLPAPKYPVSRMILIGFSSAMKRSYLCGSSVCFRLLYSKGAWFAPCMDETSRNRTKAVAFAQRLHLPRRRFYACDTMQGRHMNRCWPREVFLARPRCAPAHFPFAVCRRRYLCP